eukprot:6208715-Pleurochrysis_carterae.AAC.2
MDVLMAVRGRRGNVWNSRREGVSGGGHEYMKGLAGSYSMPAHRARARARPKHALFLFAHTHGLVQWRIQF